MPAAPLATPHKPPQPAKWHIDPDWQPDARGRRYAITMGLTDDTLPAAVARFIATQQQMPPDRHKTDWQQRWRAHCALMPRVRKARGGAGGGSQSHQAGQGHAASRPRGTRLGSEANRPVELPL
jgi:hypothetical protein